MKIFEKLGGELNCRMTPNNEETKKKIVDTSKRIEVSRLIEFIFT